MWPEWLTSVLFQFPIVVVIGFVAWYAYNQVKEANAAAQKREEESFKARLAELRESKDQEIARLSDELLAELRELGKKIASLERRLKALGERDET